jgi:hypothetical protein
MVTGEVTGDTDAKITRRGVTEEALIDIGYPAVSLANISWRGGSDERAFSGPPRTGQCFHAFKPI